MPQSSNLKEIAKALNLPIESFGDKESIFQLETLLDTCKFLDELETTFRGLDGIMEYINNPNFPYVVTTVSRL